MQQLLEVLKNGAVFTQAQVDSAIQNLIDPEVQEADKVQFLLSLTQRGETPLELAFFARALLSRSWAFGLEGDELPGGIMDVCGTGGDGRNTFNVSTCVAFVLAAGGVRVAKHGNRGVTSRSGGFDVLDALEVRFHHEPLYARRCLEETNLCFLFAPLYHPAFKALAPLRKACAERGSRTIFNLLGPLLNPARPTTQLIGLPQADLPGRYIVAMRETGLISGMAVCGQTEIGAPMDELSVSGPSEISHLQGDIIQNSRLDPLSLGFHPVASSIFNAGDSLDSARVITAILDGTDTTARRDIVLLNAGAAFTLSGKVHTLEAGIALAQEQIDSGRATAKLKQIRELTQKLPVYIAPKPVTAPIPAAYVM